MKRQPKTRYLNFDCISCGKPLKEALCECGFKELRDPMIVTEDWIMEMRNDLGCTEQELAKMWPGPIFVIDDASW